MLVPLSWLKDFVTIDRPVEQVDRLLTNAGLEVKTIEKIGIPGAALEWDRELVLLQVKVDRQTRAEVIELCQIFRAKIIDVGNSVITIEITGDGQKIAKFTALMENFGIIDLTRTGRIALPRLNAAPADEADAAD